jgi:O-antigen/teichoic acid export membrane protein
MATPLVQIVLTSKWLPSIPYIRIFCVLYMFQPIHTTNTNVIKALGHSGTRLKQEIITKGIGIILLLMSMKYGVLAIAYAYLAGNFINQYINSYPCKNLIGYSYWEQLKDIFPSTLLAIVMGGIVYLVSFLKLQIYIQIILQIIVGMTVYIAGSIIFHLDSFYYLLNMVGVRRNSNGIKK